MKKSTDQLFWIPNTAEGKLFLELAKKYLNQDSYVLLARGRTPNHKKLKKDKFQQNVLRDIPLKYAGNIAVYLKAKIDSDTVTVGWSDATQLRLLHRAQRKDDAKMRQQDLILNEYAKAFEDIRVKIEYITTLKKEEM